MVPSPSPPGPAPRLDAGVVAGCVARVGHVATDLDGFSGHRTPQQGAAVAVAPAQVPDDGPTGGHFEDAGSIPW